MTVVDLWDTNIEEAPKIPEGDFYVLAGINKRTNRQLYLSTFEDCDDWMVTVVPTKMSYTRAQYMIAKAKQDIEVKTKSNEECKYPPFEIISVESHLLTSGRGVVNL